MSAPEFAFAPKFAYHRRHRRLHGVRLVTRELLPGGTAPASTFVAAYGFAAGACKGGSPVKIGILSLGGSYEASDLKTAAAQFGFPMPAVSVLLAGGAQQDPDDHDSNVENQLDLQCVASAWSHLTGAPATIVICFAPNVEGGMLSGVQALVAAGCKIVSVSWGGPAVSWSPAERAGLAAAFAAYTSAGVTFFAAAGDNSEDDGTSTPTVDYPCSDPSVWAVGGTSVVLSPGGGIASESAWGDGQPGDEGGGGGFDPSVAQPPWQAGIVTAAPGGKVCRGVPDTSANADPDTGYQIFVNGSATVVGGTSASTPTTAAIVAASKSIQASEPGQLLSRVYAQRVKATNDITRGSNGAPAAAGWDPATGLGSPCGAAFVTALGASVQPVSLPAPAPVLTSPTPPVSTGPVTLAEAQSWILAGFAAGPVMMFRGQAETIAVTSLAKHWLATPKDEDVAADMLRPKT